MPKLAPYGFLRHFLSALANLPAGTGAATLRAAFTPGFQLTVEKVRFITTVAGTGAGASRVVRLLKNGATVIATRTLVLADTAAIGQTVDFTVTAADATLRDTDTLTIDVAAGGTAFTAGQGIVEVQCRQRPQQAS